MLHPFKDARETLVQEVFMTLLKLFMLTLCKWEYHCAAGLLFDWFGFVHCSFTYEGECLGLLMIVSLTLGVSPWSRGNGRRLSIERLWVRIPFPALVLSFVAKNWTLWMGEDSNLIEKSKVWILLTDTGWGNSQRQFSETNWAVFEKDCNR